MTKLVRFENYYETLFFLETEKYISSNINYGYGDLTRATDSIITFQNTQYRCSEFLKILDDNDILTCIETPYYKSTSNFPISLPNGTCVKYFELEFIYLNLSKLKSIKNNNFYFNENENRLLNLQEAAIFLNVSARTMYRMIEAQTIKSIKIGSKNLFRYGDLLGLCNMYKSN
jgi:excisionase family DNA binding protein